MEGLIAKNVNENIAIKPEDQELKEAEGVLEQLKQKGEQMKIQIDHLMNEWQKNQEETFMQMSKTVLLEKKQYYTEEYNLNLSEFSNEMDDLIARLPNGERKRYLSQKLKDQDLFLEVCAKMNPQDFMNLKEKRSKIDAIIEASGIK